MSLGILELGFLSLVVLPLLLVVPLSTWWVWRDSQQRGTDRAVSLAWALGTFFVWLPVFVVYLVLREDPRFNGPNAFGTGARQPASTSSSSMDAPRWDPPPPPQG